MSMPGFLIGFSVIFAAASPPAPPVTSLAYRPDGKILAAGTQGEVLLVDPATGEALNRIMPQTGRVTALAFNKAGTRLAVASGEPAKSGEIRVYDVSNEDAKLASTVANAHKDVVYALAYSPDGTLASAGYDRVIKLWNSSMIGEPRVLNDHSDTVNGLSFHPDGKLLASAASDRAVKVWDVASGKRLYTLGDSTDWVYAVAWSPDGKHLAAAGVDKSIRVWEANAEEGKLIHAVFAHTQPVTRIVYSKDGKTLYSISEGTNIKRWDAATMKEQFVFPPQDDTMLSLALSPDQKQLAVGFFNGKLKLFDAQTGKVSAEPLPAKPKAKPPEKKEEPDRYPRVQETGPRDSPRIGLKVQLPATLVGNIGKAGDADYFRFDLKAGQELSVQVMPSESKLESILELTDADGNLLAESGDGLLAFKSPKQAAYALGIRDKDFRGGADFTYRISVGNFPLVTGVSPLSVEQGKDVTAALLGANLGEQRAVRVAAPKDAKPGSKIPVPLPKFSEKAVGSAQLIVGEFPEKPTERDAASVPVPGAATGVIHAPGISQTVSFPAKKGQSLIVEVEARRLGTPLDSVIEILDANNKPVLRNTLRCTARIIQTFRDVDSAQSGIRLESWNELAIDDYLYVNGEIMRVKQLPKNPDDDCQFYQIAGQRKGFFDTTPTHHANGSAMYKIEFHPPGTTFPPNGLPTYDLPYRNDDGGAGYGKDSRIFFDPPADGEYKVRISDARGMGGEQYAYRLTVRPPQPSYTVNISPAAPKVWRGGSVPVTVTATRIDGFNGEISFKFMDLPPGFESPETTIESGQTTAVVPIYAAKTAAKPGVEMPIKYKTSAVISGYTDPESSSARLRASVATFEGTTIELLEPGDIVTTTNVQQVTIKPGQQAKLLVTVERHNGFTGRIPIDVRGLPHGVRVLNIGLNGILINPNETSREVVLFAEPWVKPMERPFIVLATREGKRTEHGARPVMLKVTE